MQAPIPAIYEIREKSEINFTRMSQIIGPGTMWYQDMHKVGNAIPIFLRYKITG